MHAVAEPEGGPITAPLLLLLFPRDESTRSTLLRDALRVPARELLTPDLGGRRDSPNGSLFHPVMVDVVPRSSPLVRRPGASRRASGAPRRRQETGDRSQSRGFDAVKREDS